MLPALLGESKQGRDHLVEHARDIALRKGPWKLAPQPKGPTELYNLSKDIGETKNVAAENPQVVTEMTAMLEKIRSAGRSRP